MSTPAQIAANRANSKLSTGPRTPAGKAVSSQNNFKLGLACRPFAVLPGEDQEEFDRYTAALTNEYNPQTTIERTLVFKIAQHHWLSQRASLPSTCCSTTSGSSTAKKKNAASLSFCVIRRITIAPSTKPATNWTN